MTRDNTQHVLTDREGVQATLERISAARRRLVFKTHPTARVTVTQSLIDAIVAAGGRIDRVES